MDNDPIDPTNKKILIQIEATIGTTGRMISNSKSRYHIENPGHNIIFNCHIGTVETIFWWGDIDITLDGEKLLRLASLLDQRIYLFSEYDGYLIRYRSKPIQTDIAIYSYTHDGGRLLTPNRNHSSIQTTEIHDLADHIFGSASKAGSWFLTELIALNGLSPETACSTPEGQKQVVKILKKIQCGEFV